MGRVTWLVHEIVCHRQDVAATAMSCRDCKKVLRLALFWRLGVVQGSNLRPLDRRSPALCISEKRAYEIRNVVRVRLVSRSLMVEPCCFLSLAAYDIGLAMSRAWVANTWLSDVTMWQCLTWYCGMKRSWRSRDVFPQLASSWGCRFDSSPGLLVFLLFSR